jgi:opacity protein-like surface antigen
MPVYTAPSPAAWYIRGDLGWARHDDPTMVEDSRYDLFGARIDDAWTLGGGIGYRFSRNVRGDLTWDHRFEADAEGTLSAGATGQPFAGATRKFGLKSDVFLANVYYDVDLGSRISPYFGVGLGFTHNKTTGGAITDACGCSGTIGGSSDWSVAGAFMSGATINLGGRFNLDAGYRLLYLGDAQTGVITGTTAAPGGGSVATTAGETHVRDIWAHELRLGVRMDLR